MSAGTFAAFSKFHLNTSNSPYAKVVYFVEEHNFHVEWHSRFGVEMGEKLKSMPRVTIHRRPENSQLGMRFMHNWLRKRPYALCESCRGSGDLQLCYSLLGPLLFNFLEFWSIKQGYLEIFRAPGAPERTARRRALGHALPLPQTPPWARHGRRCPTGSTRLAQGAWMARPPPLLAIPLAPRVRGHRADHPTWSLSYRRARRHRPRQSRYSTALARKALPHRLGPGYKGRARTPPLRACAQNSRATPTTEPPHYHSRPSRRATPASHPSDVALS
jgi:hypothetical protein